MADRSFCDEEDEKEEKLSVSFASRYGTGMCEGSRPALSSTYFPKREPCEKF